MTNETDKTTSGQPFKAGYVAIVGRPNVGKSTLMNAFVQSKLAIVTPKPQTTRNPVLGIMSGTGFQVIFWDTPGLLKPRYLLQQGMMAKAHEAVRDSDLVLFMFEAGRGIRPGEREHADAISDTGKPMLALINKIDAVAKANLLPMISELDGWGMFHDIVPISALQADGLDALQQALLGMLPEGAPLYPEEELTNQPERFFVAEIVREKIFQQYGKEIPYSTAVTIEEFKERHGRKDFISAEIHVERTTQKAILIGKGGQALKRVGQEARRDIERFLGRPVRLELYVRVKKKWRSDPNELRRLGY